MRPASKVVLFVSSIMLFAGGCNNPRVEENITPNEQPVEERSSSFRYDFSARQEMAKYKFSAQVPKGWEVEYVDAIDSINIFIPGEASSNLESSQIFIRSFTANNFLTLSSVNVLDREETMVDGRSAVRYEIKKKDSQPNFSSQPTWRNGQHKLIDIRFQPENPSLFYVFAYNPELPWEAFENFLKSLEFSN